MTLLTAKRFWVFLDREVLFLISWDALLAILYSYILICLIIPQSNLFDYSTKDKALPFLPARPVRPIR